jgi:hypothetical protein
MRFVEDLRSGLFVELQLTVLYVKVLVQYIYKCWYMYTIINEHKFCRGMGYLPLCQCCLGALENARASVLLLSCTAFSSPCLEFVP